jgi:gluconate 5-dehydrogenase
MGTTAFSLKGRKALVTGGNTGIGLGIARGLAEAGAQVGICGRDKAKSRAALEELEKIQPGCKAFAFELEDLQGLPNSYAAASDAMGGIDVLVNNAGMHRRGPAETIKTEDFEQILRVNLTAPYVLSQCFAREHIASGTPGSVIMICSLMSEQARKTTSPYTATKGGIRQLVKALAVDWAEHGIRVNGLGPGYFKTEMTRPLWEDPEFDTWVVGRTPLGRWGDTSDFAGPAVFLASDASRFVTGQILYIDGGWLATF